jgi:hypothetical protein
LASPRTSPAGPPRVTGITSGVRILDRTADPLDAAAPLKERSDALVRLRLHDDARKWMQEVHRLRAHAVERAKALEEEKRRLRHAPSHDLVDHAPKQLLLLRRRHGDTGRLHMERMLQRRTQSRAQ